jgi:hypothetical protein
MFVCCVYMLCCTVWVEVSATGWSLVQKSPTACLYVCDHETPKREAKGSSLTISNCEWKNEWMNIILDNNIIFKLFLSTNTNYSSHSVSKLLFSSSYLRLFR